MKQICRICKIEKDINDFPKRNDTKNGYRSECKKCRNEARKQYYIEHKEKELINRKEYRNKNLESIKRQRKQYYFEHKTDLLEKSKKYREKNREKLNEYAKEYRKTHRKEITNKRKEKRHNDENYYFEIYLRNKINNYLYRNGKIKKKNTVKEILGCDYVYFKKYIESKFKDGMSWDNRGEWHLDHIIPLATAKNYNDLIKLNHYTNFQPLWAYENLKKGKYMKGELL